MIERLLLVLALICGATLVTAQEPATLIADRIGIEADNVIVAEGNVEVFYEGNRLKATRVTYDRTDERLSIDGPLVLTQGEDTVVLASSAELDDQLQNGILTSARMVLDQQMQLAAAQIERSGDRFTRLSRVVASSCEVCMGGPPLWEIRASRVIRDEEELQLYFDDAQFRVLGLPIFYLPRLRLPDPSIRRATGLLPPRIRSRSQLGTGIQLPYFIVINDHADMTLSPYVSSETQTLEFNFRQELKRGRLSFDAALSNDEIEPDGTRGYFFADGRFELPRDFSLNFDLELVSDDSYLFDYGITERDRLSSSLSFDRVRDDQAVEAGFTSFRTLRARDLTIERELPNQLADFTIEQRVFEDPVWGQAWATLSGATVGRVSSDDEVGRDVTRLTASFGWTASQVFGPGIVADADVRLDLDRYRLSQDSTLPGNGQRVTPAAAVALSLPMSRTDAAGVRHLLEPTVQLAWSETTGDEAPNEDSTGVEFDEGNLFSLSRFPGEDARETGLRANIGLTWTRYDPDGWSLGLTAGRVLRFEDENQFAFETGLSGQASDWLVSGNLQIDNRVDLLSRTLLDDNFDVSRSESRVRWRDDRFSLSGTHLWRAADTLEGSLDDISEFSFDGAYRANRFWTATADWRLDADAGETTRAGVGLRYVNECISVDLSVSRSFTDSANIDPVTDVDFRVALNGFGSGRGTRSARRRCGG